MKSLLIIVVLFCVSIVTNGQVKKVYLSKDGQFTDSVNAFNYVLIQKLDDSAYAVQRYYMNNYLIFKGTYKDSSLTIFHGKFTYYDVQQSSSRIRYVVDSQKFDTITTPEQNFVNQRGYYIDGQKNGVWTNYNANGTFSKSDTYKNGKLNGLSQMSYNADNKVGIEGNYSDDDRTGEWYILSSLGDTIQTDYYSKGAIIKTVYHISEKKFKPRLKSGKPLSDLSVYLRGKISRENRILINKGYQGTYSFTLLPDGTLSKPIVEFVGNLKIDTVLVKTLLNGPKWKPAQIDDKPVESRLTINILPLTQNDPTIEVEISAPFVKGFIGYSEGSISKNQINNAPFRINTQKGMVREFRVKVIN